MSKKILWTMVIIAIALFMLFYSRMDIFTNIDKSSDNNRVQIGGHFNLIGQNGELFDSHQIKTPLKVIFFGFTYCPEICPTGLNNISSALNEIGDEAKLVTPIFISVDPERDTPEQLKLYIEDFYPSFIALTGNSDSIRKVTNQYKAYSAKRDDPDSSEYTVDHSTYIYILGKDYEYLSHMGHDSSSEKIAEKIKAYLK